MKAKERHKNKLLEFMGNPENDFPNRLEMGLEVLGFNDKSHLYRHFTPDELSELEREAVELRRKKMSGASVRIDKALMKAAESGNVKAIKLFYQRIENWNPSRKLEVGVDEYTFDRILDEIDGKTKGIPKTEEPT